MKEQMREALDLYLKDYPISATVSDIFEAGYKASIPTNYIGNQTEAFESWYQKTYVHFGQANFHLNSYGEYVDDDIESSWCAWKAALSALPANHKLTQAVNALAAQTGESPESITEWLTDKGGLTQLMLSHFGGMSSQAQQQDKQPVAWRLNKFAEGKKPGTWNQNVSDVPHIYQDKNMAENKLEEWRTFDNLPTAFIEPLYLQSQAQQPANIRQIVKNAILANSHPAEDWHLAFNDAEEIDIVANQVASKLHNDFGDPYQGAREDLAIWKKRALDAESKLQSQAQQPAQEPAPTMSQFASKADYEAAISKQPAPVTVTLTGHQLRCALALINPDGETDIDQLEDYLTFGIVTHYDDAGVIGRGMACWNDDTDGVLPLDDALFEPAKQEGKWISVDTKLPELGEKVIGIYDGSLCAFMRVCAEDDNWCWAIGRNDLYDEFFYDADDDYQITHWMPLPLPPVKEVTE